MKPGALPWPIVAAAMVGGVPNGAAFGIGSAAGAVLTCLDLPVMTVGLGIYLPFYISLVAVIGGIVRLIFNAVRRKRGFEGMGRLLQPACSEARAWWA